MLACHQGSKCLKIERELRDFGDPAAFSTCPGCGSRLESRNGQVECPSCG